MRSLTEIAQALQAGTTTSEQLVEECLARCLDPQGEGARVFVSLDAAGARASARAMDALRGAGCEPSPWSGIPVSIKDVFDVRNQVTRAGSRVYAPAPASRDAPVVARWRQAGLVLIGRTNMSEFAYSGLGVNPHFGTPTNPWDRAVGRLPGGSSSGAAVSVTDQMAFGALGSDTGGSCRIPAALSGCVGFKSTQGRLPRAGVVPLSAALDSVGVLAPTVACAAVLDGLARGVSEPRPADVAARPPRLAIPRNYFFDGMDSAVSAAFERLSGRLADAGAALIEVRIDALDMIADMNAGGGFQAAEAYAWHHDLLAAHAEQYDPRIRARIERGARLTARDLIVLGQRRSGLIAAAVEALGGFDGMLFPTTPIVAPSLADVEDEAEYGRLNLLLLRNSTVINLLDGCAVSVPMHRSGEPPSGVTVAGLGATDTAVLRTAAWIEEHV